MFHHYKTIVLLFCGKEKRENTIFRGIDKSFHGRYTKEKRKTEDAARKKFFFGDNLARRR